MQHNTAMSDASDLATMLSIRGKPDADRAGIDAFIFARFGHPRAIMHIDRIGLSRRADELGVLHFLQLMHDSETMMLPLIDQHLGQFLRRDGNALLSVFTAPDDALNAALAITEAVQAANQQRLPEERLDVCVGLGFGEVLLIDSHDAWGAQVKAASKLGEEVATGGEILATEAFRLAVSDAPFSEFGVLFGTRPAYRWVGNALKIPETGY